MQYDFGKTIEQGKFVYIGSLNKPPTAIRTAITKLRARARRKGYSTRVYLDQMLEANPRMKPDFESSNPEADQLFKEDYNHKNNEKDCRQCPIENLISRKHRTQYDPVVHYSLINSANQVIKNAVTRERLRREKGILYFKMEAGGLMNNFPYIIIRGICGESLFLFLY